MEKSLSLASSRVAELRVRLFDGGWKGSAPEYVSCLWVGWPLQHQIIDVPARQGVLIWDEVCQVGMCGRCVPATTCGSLTSVLFDTHVCNVEGCGLIADVLNPLVK
jgi:hypothetical protein